MLARSPCNAAKTAVATTTLARKANSSHAIVAGIPQGGAGVGSLSVVKLMRQVIRAASGGLLSSAHPTAERVPLVFGHAGLVAERHGAILHGLHIDLLGEAAHFGNALERHVLRGLLECRMRRIARVTHQAVLAN